MHLLDLKALLQQDILHLMRLLTSGFPHHFASALYLKYFGYAHSLLTPLVALLQPQLLPRHLLPRYLLPLALYLALAALR